MQDSTAKRIPTKQPDVPQPGTYTPRTALEKHVAFFDRNKDGLLTPSESWEGFRAVGYGWLMSFLGTFLVHLFLSYPTLDTWWPDPFFTVHLKNIHRCKHGSDTAVYDERGEMRLDRLQWLFSTFSRPTVGVPMVASATGGASRPPTSAIGFWEGVQMIYYNRDMWDWSGWLSAIIEWSFMYVLAAENGLVPVDAIRGQYDGSLFYELEQKEKGKKIR